jgi:spermidine/putrescine transport system permease protein
VPRCHTGIVASFALCFLVAAGDYVTPTLVGGTMNMIGNQISAQFGLFFNWPLGSAMSFVTLGIATAIVVLFSVLLAQWRPR